MKYKSNNILGKVKDFWEDLIKCFRTDKLGRFLVFFENPRMFIWFIVCFLIATLRYKPLSMMNLKAYYFIIFLTFVGYLILISFVCSNIIEYILRYANGVRKIATHTEKERIVPLFKEVYTKAFRNNKGIGRKIKPYIVDSMEVNAFIVGRNTLVITRGALETFNDEELKGIIAHEFGHLKNHDGQIALLLQFCSNILLWIFIIISFIFRFFERLFENNILGDLFGIIRQIFEFVVKAVVFVFTLLVSGGSRHTEYKADMYAKKIGYGEQLKNALYILYDMEISDKKGLIKNLKRTHPILAYRIERLENK